MDKGEVPSHEGAAGTLRCTQRMNVQRKTNNDWTI